MARPTDALRADYEGQRRPNWQAYIFGDLFGVAAERDAARAELARLSAALDIAREALAGQVKRGERPKRQVSYTSSDARPAPVGERVPEGVVWVRKTESGPWEVLVDGAIVSTHTTPDAARITARRHIAALVPDTQHEGEPRVSDRVLAAYIGIVADVAVAAETADYPHTLRAVS